MSSLTKILVHTIISLAQGGFVYQSVTSAEFHFEHTLDFIAHGFCAGIAEMDMNLVGRLTDFLYHRRRVSGALDAVTASATCIVRGSLFMALLSPNGSVPPGKNQSCLLFTMSFAVCRVAPAFSSRKFFPSKRIGAHRSKIRS